MIFVIEDTENNKFGCFVSERFKRYDKCYEYDTYDDYAFIFTLKNNGRIKEGNGMMKFNITDPEHAFHLSFEDSEWLFWVGADDITVMKKGIEGSHINQKSFDFQGKQNVLIGRTGTDEDGKGNFTPKRVVAIQMK